MSTPLPGIPSLSSRADPDVISESARVAERLIQIQPTLDEVLFGEVNDHGYRARIEATVAHAPTAAGTYHWNAAVFALRSNLNLRGWKIKNQRNCPLIISPDKSVAIAVMTGNADTGVIAGKPTNQAQKGVVIEKAVAENLQFELFDPRILSELNRSRDGTQLWVLLYHVGSDLGGAEEVRSELSLPSRFARKQIEDWAERIILKTLRPNDNSDPIVRPEDFNPPSVDVPVERKTG